MLPQELLDKIVELLSDDPPSLLALSCTAQCLRARSQALLFHVLVLSPTQSPSSYIPLLEMSPHILNYVRRLRVTFATTKNTSTAVPFPRRPFYEDNSFGRLYHAVTNMDELEMMYLAGGWIGADLLLPILSSPRVRTLRLSQVFFPNPQSLFHTLSYFPSVSSLHLDIIHIMGGKSSSLDFKNVSLTEVSLAACLVVSPSLSILFTDIGWLKHLRSLILEGYEAKHLFIYSKIIPKLPYLISLTLRHSVYDRQTEEPLAAGIPDVFPLQKIRSLRLSVPGVASSLTRWWVGHLTQTTAVSLEYLAIDFSYADVGAASEMQPSMAAWRDMESTLWRRLPKLKSLSMNTRGYR